MAQATESSRKEGEVMMKPKKINPFDQDPESVWMFAVDNDGSQLINVELHFHKEGITILQLEGGPGEVKRLHRQCLDISWEDIKREMSKHEGGK